MKQTHGLEGQPPVYCELEVLATGNDEMDTLLQATRPLTVCVCGM